MSYKISKDNIEVFKALMLLQAELKSAPKKSEVSYNGSLQYMYSDIASVMDTIRPLMAKNELTLWQPVSIDYENRISKIVKFVKTESQYNPKKYQKEECPVEVEVPVVTVTTKLIHVSGQWIEMALSMTPNEDTAQAIGSIITYARRYSIMTMLGIAPAEDDGTSAVQLTQEPEPRIVPSKSSSKPEKASQAPKTAYRTEPKAETKVEPSKIFIVDSEGRNRYNKETHELDDNLQSSGGLITTEYWKHLLNLIQVNLNNDKKAFLKYLEVELGIKEFYNIPLAMYTDIVNTITKTPEKIVG